MKKTSYFTHISALTSLFVLGNAVIILPMGKVNEFTFLSFLISAVFGIILYFPASLCAKKLLGEKNHKNQILKTVQIILLLALSVFAIFCVADAFSAFLNFVKVIILPNTATFFITLIFAVCVLYFALKKAENILKFFLIFAVLSGAIVLFFFFATSFDFNLRNIFIFRLPDLKTFLNQATEYVKNPVMPTLILPFYNMSVFENTKKGASLIGLLCGYILLGLCVIGSVLLFGANFAGDLEFPYFSASSTVSFGRLFTRLDGFCYFLFFIAVLARITVCLHVTFYSLKKINSVLNTKTE